MVSLVANNQPLTSSGFVTLMATVTDPDGLGNLAGGSLHLASTGQLLGPFSGAVGSYSYTLRWNELPTSVTTFSTSGTSVELEARFLDASSAMGTRRVTVTLSCSGQSACSGRCVSLLSDPQNCGVCGQQAPSGGVCTNGVPGCSSASTLCNGACVSLASDPANCGSCGRSCSAWASTRGFSSAATSCSQNKCRTIYETTSRNTCSALCSQRSSVCQVRGTYDPECTIYVGSGDTLGTCAVYRVTPSSSRCGAWGSDCATTPPPSITYSSQTCQFQSMKCFCAEP